MAKGRKTGGRQRGTPNKVTKHGRLALLAIVEKRFQDLDEMIEDTWRGIEIEKQMQDGATVVGRLNADPAGAAKLVLMAAEYCYPKLGRQEHVGDEGGPIEFVIRDLAKEG